MARPTTKQSLIVAAGGEFEKLWKLIDSLSEEKQNATFAFEDRDRNIRDVLIHLYEWHQLLLKWIRSNRAGNAANFLPEPYNWKTYPQMNVEFWRKHQSTPLAEAKTVLEASHSEAMQVIGSFSDEELFIKKYFPWTGTTNLGSYCISATSSHYDWAIKKIKQHIKSGGL
jgi:Uncharacterized conserved protein